MTRLRPRLDRAHYRAGEVVRGTVDVLEGRPSRALEARLDYVERPPTAEVATSISSGPLHTGDLTAGASFAFELALPADALPNLESAHGPLFWQLDVKSDRRGRDVHERQRVQIG